MCYEFMQDVDAMVTSDLQSFCDSAFPHYAELTAEEKVTVHEI